MNALAAEAEAETHKNKLPLIVALGQYPAEDMYREIVDHTRNLGWPTLKVVNHLRKWYDFPGGEKPPYRSMSLMFYALDEEGAFRFLQELNEREFLRRGGVTDEELAKLEGPLAVEAAYEAWLAAHNDIPF